MAEPVRDVRDVQVRLGQLRQEWDSFRSNNYDRKGMRLTNNGRSVDIGDYVIRGEINDLIIDALQNLDKLEIKQLVTNIGSTGGLQNPLVESIRASLDSTYDIGQPAGGNRIRWAFADIFNGEKLEITDLAHVAHWSLVQDVADTSKLYINDATPLPIITLDSGPSSANSVFIHGNIYPDFDYDSGTPRKIGDSPTGDIYLIVQSANIYAGKSTAAGTLKIYPASGASKNITLDSDGFNYDASLIPILDSVHGLGTNTRRWSNCFLDLVNIESLEITNSTHTTHWSIKQQAGDVEVLNLIETDGSSVFAKFDLNTIANQPFMEIDADIFPLTDQTRQVGAATGSNKIFSSISAVSIRAGKTGVAGGVYISPTGGGSQVQILADSDGFTFTDSLKPNAHNFDTLGLSDKIFADIFSKKVTIGKSSATRLQGILEIANVTDSNVAQLLGITKDGIGTMEVNGSLSIGSSSNFYSRVFSGGDASCSGIDDGWMGFRTDTNELQVCIGGTLVKVTLT